MKQLCSFAIFDDLESTDAPLKNQPGSFPFDLDAAQRNWVETTFAGMSLAAKIGQLLHPMLTHFDSKVDQNELIRTIIEFQTGGAFLFCRPYRVLRDVVRQVAPHMEVPIVLSGDCEAGANAIEEGAAFGSAMGLAAIEDLKEGARLAYMAGKAAAVQGAAVGVKWTFAPVVDINSNHQNPITNIRAYGDKIERIIVLSSAYIRGLQDHGMAACIKHFPGDGQDGRDQHLVTPINPLSLAEWDKTYGRTFRAGIKAGVYTVMMGHLAMPHLSSRHPDTGLLLPATLDARIQVDLLRKRLGFNGLIISDAILMGGAYFHAKSEGELVVRNIATGSDMVLFVEDVRGAVKSIRRALDNGGLTEERINDAVYRVLTLKAQLNLHECKPLPDDKNADKVFRGTEFAEDIALAGERCVTLMRDLNGIYPVKLKPGSKIVLYKMPSEISDIPALVVAGQLSESASKSAMHVALEERGYKVASVFEPNAYEREIKDADLLIYVFDPAPSAGRGSIRLAQRAHQFLDRKRIVSGFPVLFVSLGSPYSLWEISWAHNFVCCYSRADNVQKACVRAMLGEISFCGKVPVSIPE